MFKRGQSLFLTAGIPLLALMVACSSGDGATPAQESASGSVDKLVKMIETGIEVDYTPLESPKGALQKADLIVRGVLVDVTDGVSVQYDDPALTARRAGGYLTLVVDVTKVLAGDASRVKDGKVYVEVPRSPVTSPSEVSRANPRAQVVMVLDDLGDWRPQPNAKVKPPAGVPADANLFAAYNDGLWLQGPADQEMRGIGVHRSELAPEWGQVRTIDQFASTIERARN